VTLGEPFHWMTEHGTKFAPLAVFVPVTVKVNCPDPAIAPVGAMEATLGTAREGGTVTENESELETAEPLEAVIVAVPDTGVRVSVSGMTTVRYGGGAG
jgi:hypothetical protein